MNDGLQTILVFTSLPLAVWALTWVHVLSRGPIVFGAWAFSCLDVERCKCKRRDIFMLVSSPKTPMCKYRTQLAINQYPSLVLLSMEEPATTRRLLCQQVEVVRAKFTANCEFQVSSCNISGL
jgi:hypothetical protein